MYFPSPCDDAPASSSSPCDDAPAFSSSPSAASSPGPSPSTCASDGTAQSPWGSHLDKLLSSGTAPCAGGEQDREVTVTSLRDRALPEARVGHQCHTGELVPSLHPNTNTRPALLAMHRNQINSRRRRWHSRNSPLPVPVWSTRHQTPLE